jgi:hypothetical protein
MNKIKQNKSCKCEIYSDDNDWGENHTYTKVFCDECKIIYDNDTLLLENKKNEILEKFKITPTNILVNDLFDIQKQSLCKDKKMSYNMYCLKEVYCMCCIKNIQLNNLDKHIKSLGHINKLPIKDEELNKKAVHANKNKQTSIKANKIIKLYNSRDITKEEFNIKMQELGLNVKYK